MPPLTEAHPAPGAALLVLVQVRPGARLKGFARFLALKHRLARVPGVPGLRFARVLGMGYEGGFGLRPSLSGLGVLGAFEDKSAAEGFLAASPELAALRESAREFFSLHLAPRGSRGAWGGVQPFGATPGTPSAGCVAALTRASIRPAAAHRFWRHAPRAQGSLANARGCLLAVGLGEAPLLRQATFSLWESSAALEGYARSGSHLTAARAAAGEAYFSESMFTRFTPLAASGTWRGCDASCLTPLFGAMAGA